MLDLGFDPWSAGDAEILAAFKIRKIGQRLVSDKRLGPLYDTLSVELRNYPDDLLDNLGLVVADLLTGAQRAMTEHDREQLVMALSEMAQLISGARSRLG